MSKLLKISLVVGGVAAVGVGAWLLYRHFNNDGVKQDLSDIRTNPERKRNRVIKFT
jgi:hypothetical protein